jgi:hypothetical protein
MFGGSFKEGRSKNLVLHEIDSAPFDAILKSLYQGRPPVVNAASVYGLLKTSNFLGLREVERCCVNFVLENITSINVLNNFSLARAQNNTELVDTLGKHILRHFASFVKEDMFIDLQYDDLNHLLNRYRSSSSSFKFENFLLDALIRWVHYSTAERKKSFEKLIELVDFEKISVEYIEFLIEKYKVDGQIFKEPGSDQVLKQGMPLRKAVIDSLMLNNETDNDYNALPTSILYEDPRFSKDATLHVCMMTLDKWETNYSIYSMDNSKVEPEWFLSCNFSKRNRSQYSPSLCAYVALDEPNSLYCMEYNTYKSEMLFHAYSSINFSSNPHVLRPFPILRDFTRISDPFLCMSGANGRIYLYEGSGKAAWSDRIGNLLPDFSKEEYERRIYNYNCGIDKWFPVPEMKTKLNDSYLIANDKLVYLIGGNEDSSNVNRANYVQAYDYRVPHWLELPRSHSNETVVHGAVQKSTYSGCFVNEKLYLYYRNLMQVFDPVAGRWEKVKEYTPLEDNWTRQLKIASYNNSVWVINDCPKENCEIYDATSQEWRDLGPLQSLFNINDVFGLSFSRVMDVFVLKPLVL